MVFDLGATIWLLLVLGILGTFAQWPRIGAYLYLVGSLLAPVTVFGGSFVRIEMVLVPLMLGISFLQRGLRWPGALLALVAWAVWVLLVSLSTGDEVNWIGCYALVRLVALSIIFASIEWTERDLVRVQLLFCVAAIPMAILSIGQVLSVPLARQLTELAYTTPSANVFLRQVALESEGYGFRAIGTFGNVSPAGAFFVTVLGIALILLSEYRNARAGRNHRVAACCLVAGFAGGLATMSGTFVAGMFPILGGAVFLSSPEKRGYSLGIVAVACVCIAAGAWAAINRSETLQEQLGYQWDRFIDGTIADSRYRGNDAVLAQAMEEIGENPFCGRGTTVTDTFIGDSVYITVVHSSGILGSLMFLSAIGMLVIRSLHSGLAGRLALMWTLSILISGVGSTGMFNQRFGDWWWATQGMLLGLACTAPCRHAVTRQERLSVVSHRPHLWSTVPQARESAPCRAQDRRRVEVNK